MNYITLLLLFPLLNNININVNAFPQGRCYVPSCEATPYDINWISEKILNSEYTESCFLISKKKCIDSSKYNCCNSFANSLYKIALSSQPSCENSVMNVTINGTKKGGGIYFTTYPNNDSSKTTGAELRLTALNIPSNIINNTEVCLTLTNPCNGIADFCIESHSDLCKFAMFDNAAHSCCPTCIMLNNIS